MEGVKPDGGRSCSLNMSGSSATPIKYRQDMPPPEGFGSIKYKRSLPYKGPSGIAIFGGLGLLMGVGWYRLIGGLRERKELHRENMQSRINLLPFLLAEMDRDMYRRQQASLARERIIMKDVKGWEVGKSPYHTTRYVPPKVLI
ncbi:NADH:ubiquinone oxidoreductase, B16.6 subunit/cell death-regulatory protein [Phaffia rhodozyma]|uniref:NADH dehydrogenase [ubiquinone] 1 alpha subcomplex subunit 13 n=1 Tax=Phaffia rhodozyma TaxID=264483 RepID=A0A0F7SMP8_PHARH|nr:NADH:ubiquinone oxidoreductase, B16.6 subunit/cell death-regulatory protein [Phaffia rhodozyma]